MSLAVPSALIFAALALPIIVFYILKVRLRRIPVSTNLFWKQIYDEKPPRSIWQRFRHLLSLLAQLLLLLLMVFALADPYFSWQALQARRMVAVIDISASMQAEDVSPSRFEASIDSAINLVEGMRFRDKMAIVLAGDSPEVVLGMSDHAPTLKRTLRSLKVSDNPTELQSAIELGKQLIGDHPNGSVVVFTDGCATSLETDFGRENPSDVAAADDSSTNEEPPVKEASKETTVDYRVFASTAANVGITQFQVRRSLIDMLGYEVLACVENASDQAVKCRLEIELDGSPVDVLPLKLEPHERWSRSLEKTSLEGGQLIATLSAFELIENEKSEAETDAESTDSQVLNSLTADDVAWAILPSQAVQKVLVVTKGNLFLRKVFEANPLVSVTVTSEFPEKWPQDSLIVLHGKVPEVLPPGNVFVVDPVDSCDAWELGEVLENPIITQVDKDSDLMTHVSLDNVVMPEARKLLFKAEPHVLAGSLSADPIYAELKRKTGRGLVLSVNLENSDLAFRTAFPIMVTNALNWFAGSSGGLRESASTGSIIEYDLSPDLAASLGDESELSLVSPSGKESKISLKETRGDSNNESTDATTDSDAGRSEPLSLGPFGERGIWTLESKSTDASKEDSNSVVIDEFAVNVSSNRETNLIPPADVLKTAGESVIAGWMVCQTDLVLPDRVDQHFVCDRVVFVSATFYFVTNFEYLRVLHDSV